MALELGSLRDAVRSLEDALREAGSPTFMDPLTPGQRSVVRAGVIQNFEFTYELCWKFMKRWLEENLGSPYVDGIPRKELFRLSAEHRLIDDVEIWFAYQKARNVTSHTYQASVADEVFAAASRFLADAQSLLRAIESKNA